MVKSQNMIRAGNLSTNLVCSFLYGKIVQLGGMAERLKAHVLKTCLGHTNVGSNPTPSAQHLSSKIYGHPGRCQSG